MKTLKDLENDFKTLQDNYKKLDEQIPRIAGITAVKYFRAGIDAGNDINGSQFASRKPKTNEAYDRRGKSYKGGKFNSGNPVLKQTGNLYDGIKFTTSGNTVTVGLDTKKVKYAQAHNEGLGHEPKRQFIGFTEALAKVIESEIKRKRKKIFDKFQKSKNE